MLKLHDLLECYEVEDDFEPDFTLEDDEEFEESLADAMRRQRAHMAAMSAASQKALTPAGADVIRREDGN